MTSNTFDLKSLYIRTAIIDAAGVLKTNFTAMSVTNHINANLPKDEPRRLDWHVASSYLDELHGRNYLRIVGHTNDGAVIYSLNFL